MKKKYGLVVAGSSGGIDNDTATKNFDSRELTFKYLDRKGYNLGVYKRNRSQPLIFPAPEFIIPHNLGYPPSYRIYVYARDNNNDYEGNNHQYELQELNGSAAVVTAKAYVDHNNLKIVVQIVNRAVANSDIYFVVLIGADNLEEDADETRYMS